ncbi:MAG: hypothetical protein AAF492_09355, partial [Verrucomicrobiota bacterium]
MEITRCWVGMDACGGSSVCTQLITVIDSTPPELSEDMDVIEVEANSEGGYADDGTLADLLDGLEADDLCDEDAEIDGNECPNFITLVCSGDEGGTLVEITLTDCAENEAVVEINLLARDTTPPAIHCPSNLALQCEGDFSPSNTGHATATDIADANPVISYSDDCGTGGGADGGGGAVNPKSGSSTKYAGKGSNDCEAIVITRCWTAVDACGNSSSCTQQIVQIDDVPPSITCPSNITLSCDDDMSPFSTGEAFGFDDCSNPTVTYSDQLEPGACTHEGSIHRTWTATDDCGNSTSLVQIITFIDEIPPNIVCPPDVTIDCSQSSHPDVTGHPISPDNCDETVEFYYEDHIEYGACPGRYTIIRDWTSYDDCGNECSCEQFIEVFDQQAPVVTAPADITVECNGDTSPAVTGTATASDNCDTNLTVSYTDTAGSGNTILRIWTATDDCGLSGAATQRIAQAGGDIEITAPADVTLECTEDTTSANTGVATASSGCSNEIAVTESDDVVTGACPQQFTIRRTWSAGDGSGQDVSAVQVITVVDTTAPVFDRLPMSVIVDYSDRDAGSGSGASGGSGSGGSGGSAASGGSRPGCTPLPTEIPPVPEVSATDDCDTDVDVNLVEVQMGDCPGVIVRSWTATDDCGNESELIQLVVLRKACVNPTDYWKDRPAEWLSPFGPVTEFELGCDGDLTSAGDALLLLNGCVGSKTDWTVRLARELIAATLNVAQGAEDDSASEAIQEARDFLCVIPIGSKPRGELKKTARRLYKA